MRKPAPRPVRPSHDPAAVARRGRPSRRSRLRVCLTSVPARDAARIARLLVDRRVAACVTAVPGATSTYRWKGEVERSRETLLLVKTTATALSRCRTLLAEAHPYDVPEILVGVPFRAGAAYEAWAHTETA